MKTLNQAIHFNNGGTFAEWQIIEQVEKSATVFQNYYLDWLNDFLTYAGYADYYGISEAEAKSRIDVGRKIHDQRTT